LRKRKLVANFFGVKRPFLIYGEINHCAQYTTDGNGQGVVHAHHFREENHDKIIAYSTGKCGKLRLDKNF
jgi:hypothetical protein